MTVTFALDPKAPTPEQVIIFRNGIAIERCSLAPRRRAHWPSIRRCLRTTAPSGSTACTS